MCSDIGAGIQAQSLTDVMGESARGSQSLLRKVTCGIQGFHLNSQGAEVGPDGRGWLAEGASEVSAGPVRVDLSTGRIHLFTSHVEGNFALRNAAND